MYGAPKFVEIGTDVETEAVGTRYTTTSISAAPKFVKIGTDVETEAVGSRYNTTSVSSISISKSMIALVV